MRAVFFMVVMAILMMVSFAVTAEPMNPDIDDGSMVMTCDEDIDNVGASEMGEVVQPVTTMAEAGDVPYRRLRGINGDEAAEAWPLSNSEADAPVLCSDVFHAESAGVTATTSERVVRILWEV